MNKKKLFLWSLYDFANSFVFINFLLYFSQWLVIDGGLSDLLFNLTFAIATVILFITAPVLAEHTDRFGNRKRFLIIATFGTAISYGLSAFFASSNANIFLITGLFLLGQYFYQLSFVFYNPLINEIADEAHRGRASGIGQFSNALGQVVGLLAMLPLAGNRLAPLIPSIAIFIILSIPFIIWYKEDTVVSQNQSKINFSSFYSKLRPFFTVSLAAPLLIAFFFYSDALVTITNNYSIFMQKVFAISDSQKSIILMVIVLMNSIGGLLSGFLSDKIGMKKSLFIVLVSWIVILPILAFSPTSMFFGVLTAVLGLLIGSMYTISRAYMSQLLDKDNLGFGFSFYTILERFSTLVGPITWGIIISTLGNNNPQSYRIAMLSMTIFVIIGLVILKYWRKA